MNNRELFTSIMIQPNKTEPYCNPEGWYLTFPTYQGKLISPPILGGKTYMQAYKLALEWQHKIQEEYNSKIPIILNDTRYSWPQFTDRSIRYRRVG